MSPALFAVLVTAAILLGGTAIVAITYLIVQSRQSARLQRRLNPEGLRPGEFSDSGSGELLQSIAGGGKKLDTLVDSSNETQQLLLQAGWRAPEHRLLFYAAQAIVPLVLLGGVGLLALMGPEQLKAKPQLLLLAALAAVMLGMLLPRMILRSAAGNRARRIKAEVPLFIHLLVLLFEAGLSTRQAFASMVRDGKGVLPELGREFELILRQMEAGGETGELLNNLSRNIAQEDLGTVLALLRQVDRYGGEIRDPLLEALKVLEDRRSLDMREMVNLMSGRMTVVMVLFFFPALLIFVAGPAFLAVITSLKGIAQ